MKREIVSCPDAPKAIGPYSQAVRMCSLLFTAGQVPLDPRSMKLVEGGIAEQTHQVMRNLAAVLAEVGAGFGDVLKSTIYVTDLGHFAALNEVYGEYFRDIDPPARSTVQVAALPMGALVEIDMIVRIPAGD